MNRTGSTASCSQGYILRAQMVCCQRSSSPLGLSMPTQFRRFNPPTFEVKNCLENGAYPFIFAKTLLKATGCKLLMNRLNNPRKYLSDFRGVSQLPIDGHPVIVISAGLVADASFFRSSAPSPNPLFLPRCR